MTAEAVRAARVRAARLELAQVAYGSKAEREAAMGRLAASHIDSPDDASSTHAFVVLRKIFSSPPKV